MRKRTFELVKIKHYYYIIIFLGIFKDLFLYLHNIFVKVEKVTFKYAFKCLLNSQLMSVKVEAAHQVATFLSII